MKMLPARKAYFLIYKFWIFDLKVQGSFQDFLLKMGYLPGHFQDKIKSQDISRISRNSRTSGHPEYNYLQLLLVNSNIRHFRWIFIPSGFVYRFSLEILPDNLNAFFSNFYCNTFPFLLMNYSPSTGNFISYTFNDIRRAKLNTPLSHAILASLSYKKSQKEPPFRILN